MSFLNRLFTREIPLWFVCLLLAIAGGSFMFIEPYLQADRLSITVSGPDGTQTELSYGSEPKLSNPNFYESVKEDLLRSHTGFIEANLSSMTLRVYKPEDSAEHPSLEVPILTKGKKGSWWETPAGLYKVEGKIPKHLSSFSPVYTEWNLPFQGNFFIHGWPYWKASGEPVTSTYSGGCIRLSSEDAKKVYDLAQAGMPVLVFEESAGSTTPTHAYSANMPDISAASYLAADLENNFVFLKKDANLSVPLGSMTKLLTALVATDYMDIERKVQLNGTSHTLYDLLFPLFLEDSDAAALAITKPLGSSRALTLMNSKAAAIGMTHTSITDPAGNATSTASTAEDIFHLANFLYNYRLFILHFTNKVIGNTSYGPSAFGGLPNTNPFKDMEGYIGGMVGKNEDGSRSALAVYEVDFGGTKRPVAIVTLGSSQVVEDTTAILDYIKRAYK